jgi:rubrerythrin
MPFSIQKLIETITTNEKYSGIFLKMYSIKMTTPGLKKLLLSMADQEKEHELELREMLTAPDLSGSFTENVPAEIVPVSFTEFSGDKKNLATMGLLTFLLDYYQKTSSLYTELARYALDTRLQIFFKRLSDNETKLKQWVRDRYDLEAL